MKIMIILGTRPEIIRLSLVIQKLDELCDLVLVHTGQNYTTTLSDVFFEELGLRAPDEYLSIRAETSAGQISQIMLAADDVLHKYRPDKVLILGDTNSGLSAIVAARMGIPVYHMEAGNRCYDDRVPEEINRRLIDHCSTVLLPYTNRSKENLLREGIHNSRIFVTGNPISEVLTHFGPEISRSTKMQELGLKPKDYFLVTVHRSETVDHPARLRSLLSGLEWLVDQYGIPIIVSVHPHTRSRLAELGLGNNGELLRLVEPMGFFDFISLETHARAVLSDSGTVTEETTIFGVPSVILRDVTERPEILEAGASVLSGVSPSNIASALRTTLKSSGTWEPPKEYLALRVSETVCKILLGLSGGQYGC